MGGTYDENLRCAPSVIIFISNIRLGDRTIKCTTIFFTVSVVDFSRHFLLVYEGGYKAKPIKRDGHWRANDDKSTSPSTVECSGLFPDKKFHSPARGYHTECIGQWRDLSVV